MGRGKIFMKLRHHRKRVWASIIILTELALIAGLLGFWHKQRVVQAEAVGIHQGLLEANLKYEEPTVSLEGKERAYEIIKKTWRNDWRVGVVLARCESGFREKVVNSIGATGYFQVNAPVHGLPIEDMQNGYANSSFSYVLYLEQGLTPWVSSESCWGDQL